MSQTVGSDGDPAVSGKFIAGQRTPNTAASGEDGCREDGGGGGGEGQNRTVDTTIFSHQTAVFSESR